jgi:hypothetical protein
MQYVHLVSLFSLHASYLLSGRVAVINAELASHFVTPVTLASTQA